MGLIGTVGNIDKINVGGTELVDIANLICVGALADAAGVGLRYSTARLALSTTSYQVPGSKSFRILAIRWVIMSATAGTGSDNSWGYGDNTVDLSNAAAPTNKVTANVMLPGPDRVAPGTVYTVGGKAEVPTGKYPFFSADGTIVHGTFYGYEV